MFELPHGYSQVLIQLINQGLATLLVIIGVGVFVYLSIRYVPIFVGHVGQIANNTKIMADDLTAVKQQTGVITNLREEVETISEGVAEIKKQCANLNADIQYLKAKNS